MIQLGSTGNSFTFIRRLGDFLNSNDGVIGQYGNRIESAEEFFAIRNSRLKRMAQDDDLHKDALALQVAAMKHGHSYQQLWCGVPVIRLPDDIQMLSELIWKVRPGCVIETGVARGGGLLLSASLMEIAGVQPLVLGIDIQILPHTEVALKNSRYFSAIHTIERSSVEPEIINELRSLMNQVPSQAPAILILDSDHSYKHVLAELELLAPELPIGSYIMVADTIIEELPEDHFSDRPWGPGNGPKTAADEFLRRHRNFEAAEEWCRRALLSEFRDGVLRKTS